MRMGWKRLRGLAVVAAMCLVLGVAGQGRCERFSFVLDAPLDREAEARLLTEQLAEAGIEAIVRVWDKRRLLAAVRQGNRVAFLSDWGSAFFGPSDLAVPKLSSGGRGNYSGYSNGYLDALLEQGSSAPSKAVRQESYIEAQRILREQTPWLFGYVLTRFDAVSERVSGYVPSMDERVNLHDVLWPGDGPLVVELEGSGFRSFDPAAYRGRTTETLIRNMFDALVTRTAEGKVVPELAESWEKAGYLAWDFNLREGARFHDGTPVTTRDVQFTFERVLNPYGLGGKASPRRALLGPLQKVEALDERTVRFILRKPYPSLLQALVHFQIVPRDYVLKVGDDAFARRPVGAGPFRFVSGSLDGEVVLERFDGYYGGSPVLKPVGPAGTKRVVFRTEPDPALRVKHLLAGLAHIIQKVPPSMAEDINGGSGVKLVYTSGTRSYQVELNNQRPPFNDIRLRKAVAHAVDWRKVLDKVYGGYGSRLATCFLPSGFGYDPQLDPLRYDPNATKLLLGGLGYDTTPIK